MGKRSTEAHGSQILASGAGEEHRALGSHLSWFGLCQERNWSRDGGGRESQDLISLKQGIQARGGAD